jgi:hypothetical protein
VRDMILSSTESLSLWECSVQGDVHGANGDKVDSKILMCYYFNLGADAEVGIDVERNRTRRRCCNYFLYVYFAVTKYFTGTADFSDVRRKVDRIT